ncbi:unnamed protein product, partial [Didymodactylos carnosus]
SYSNYNETSTARKTTRSRANNYDNFTTNLRRTALILAGVALGLGLLRICLMLCKNKPSETRNRRDLTNTS